MNYPTLQKTLYSVQAIQLALYVALLVSFSLDSAFIAMILIGKGIVSVFLGIIASLRQSFALYRVYSISSFIWVILTTIHLTMLEKLMPAPKWLPDYYFIGKTLAEPETFNPDQVRTLNILYPTLYILAIGFTSLGMFLSCLMPNPKEFVSKPKSNNEEYDDYQNNWDKTDLQSPNPYNQQQQRNMPSMLVEIPGVPLYSFPSGNSLVVHAAPRFSNSFPSFITPLNQTLIYETPQQNKSKESGIENLKSVIEIAEPYPVQPDAVETLKQSINTSKDTSKQIENNMPEELPQRKKSLNESRDTFDFTKPRKQSSLLSFYNYF